MQGRLMNTQKTVCKQYKAVRNRVYTVGQWVTSREVGTESSVGRGSPRSCLSFPWEMDTFQPSRPVRLWGKQLWWSNRWQLCGSRKTLERVTLNKRVNPKTQSMSVPVGAPVQTTVRPAGDERLVGSMGCYHIWWCRRPRFHLWVGKIPWRKEWLTHSSILTWKISWSEEPGGLQSMGLQRVGHNWATDTFTFISPENTGTGRTQVLSLCPKGGVL